MGCWSGGLSESFCERGLCMCKWGYHVKETWAGGKKSYECVAATSELTLAMAGNTTQEELESLLAFQTEQNQAVFFNLLVAGMWALASLSLLIGATVVVWKKRAHGSSAQ